MNTTMGTDLVRALQSGARLIRDGDNDAADALIRRALASADPLASAESAQIDPDALDAGLAAAEADAGTLEAVARVCLREGWYPQCAIAVRRILAGPAGHAAAQAVIARLVPVARTLATLGQHRAALAILAPLAEAPGSAAPVLLLTAQVLMSLRERDRAEALLRRCAERYPENRNAALQLAAVLTENDKAPEAVALLARSPVLQDGALDVAFVSGRALMQAGQFDAAEAAFRKVVAARPDHQIAQTNLMELVWMRTGDLAVASAALDAAIARAPARHGLRITKSRLLSSARQPRAALQELERGLALAPRNGALLAAAAAVALDVDGGQALGYARRLSELQPDARIARVNLGNALLATGHGAEARAIAEALHRDDPTDGRALAMLADAQRMLGDPACRALLDYQRLVRPAVIDVPEGWRDLDDYLAELVDTLRRLHRFRGHPVGNSLRGGGQLQLWPERSTHRAIRAFPAAIDRAIRDYLVALGHGDDPMRRRNAGGYRLAGMWSVRLRAGGFHTNHYHPSGWISSACYLHVPAAIAAGGGEGWLQFGEPAFPTSPPLPPEYFVRPTPGLLVLFPSYLWHGTVPFASAADEDRLTIAFDVLPAA